MVSFTVTRSPFCKFPSPWSDIRPFMPWFVRRSVPSHQSPWRYLHRPSWARDQEDRSWEREQRMHRPHRQWRGGGYFSKPSVQPSVGGRSRIENETCVFTYMILISLGSNLGAAQQMLAYTSRGSVAEVECVAEPESTGKEGCECEGEHRVAWKRRTYAL